MNIYILQILLKEVAFWTSYFCEAPVPVIKKKKCFPPVNLSYVNQILRPTTEPTRVERKIFPPL